jgi:hypothetical protein
MRAVLDFPQLPKVSVINASTPDRNGEHPSRISRSHHYSALAPVVMKDFFIKYIEPRATTKYYSNPPGFVKKLADQYKEHWGKTGFRFFGNRVSATWEQAGLINRLTDVAMIEEELYSITFNLDRQIHIGFYGKNRPGGKIPGRTYEERLENLRKIAHKPDQMYELSVTKQFNDYRAFSPYLEKWDGTIYMTEGIYN